MLKFITSRKPIFSYEKNQTTNKKIIGLLLGKEPRKKGIPIMMRINTPRKTGNKIWKIWKGSKSIKTNDAREVTIYRISNQIQIKMDYFISDQKVSLLSESMVKSLTDYGLLDLDSYCWTSFKEKRDATIFHTGTKDLANNISMATK